MSEKISYVYNKYPYTTIMSWEFHRHRHTFWEFVIITNGNADHFVNQKKYSLTTGDILIMKPDSIHDYKIEDVNNYEHFDFYSSSQFFKKAIESISSKLYNEFASDKDPVILSVDIETLSMLKKQLTKLNAVQTNITFKESSHALYLTLLTFICGLAVESYENKRNNCPDWLSRLLSTMSKPEFLAGNLAEIVKQSNFSHGHLCRIFKEHTGQTLLDYFTKMKIDYATVLLKNKDLTILNISLNLGYSSVSHFIKLFKKYIGISPLKYRMQSQKI